MTAYLDAFAEGKSTDYVPGVKKLDFGVDCGHLSDFTVPAEDRNRTSPFPYGGARFEYRAVGSTQVPPPPLPPVSAPTR
jgi:glutamine synthetase